MSNFLTPQKYLWFMDRAILQAERAESEGEVPVGAVIIGPNEEILAETYNLKEKKHSACLHAEILAIEEAGKKLKAWRLSGCSLIVTLEPCLMCMAALIQSRVANCYFGAYDTKGGALSLGYHFQKDRRLNHSFAVTGGIKHFENSKLISNFFKRKRLFYKDS